MFIVCPAFLFVAVICTAPPAGIANVKKLPADISTDAVLEAIDNAVTPPFTLPLNVTSFEITPGMLRACDAVVAVAALVASEALVALSAVLAFSANEADVAFPVTSPCNEPLIPADATITFEMVTFVPLSTILESIR